MPDLTPLEAAERLEIISHDIKQYDSTVVELDEAEYLDCAASLLRKIASGEYAPVVHAHITGHGYDLHCSNCGASADIGDDYCKSCGALMGGKDDSHE